MFDVYGDEIVFEGYTVAHLSPQLSLAMRAKVADAYDDRITEEDAEQREEEARKEGYEDGLEEGKDEGRRDAENEFNRELDAKVKEASERGFEDGVAFCGKAANSANTQALLTALEQIHDRLLALTARGAKPTMSDLKLAAADCRLIARRAHLAFESALPAATQPEDIFA
ncbi:hypothetical protein ACRQ5Q_24390 [Bradyrhizobium sp. PMVTL-01]|uniref:hypothetical protein n=1 Tax=Bradyrhizobium sp. PMVTL-01 TaxID=3434999 RepID=UPI003F705D50